MYIFLSGWTEYKHKKNVMKIVEKVTNMLKHVNWLFKGIKICAL